MARLASAAVTFAICLLAWSGAARAQDSEANHLVVGKSTAQGISWLPLDVGVQIGAFQRHGVDVEVISANGGAKLHQAMVAGSIDVGLGSGTDFAFLVKGAPEKAVADMADKLLDLGLTVGNGPVHSLADLKGQRIGVSTPGSLTYWLVLELARTQGWGPGGAIPVAVGGNWPAFTAALETRQVSAVVADPALGLRLQQAGKGRLLATASSYATDFTAHVIFATDAVLAEKPQAVRGFLAGWFETIGWMHAHHDESVAVATKVTGLDSAIAGQAFDLVMPMFTAQGHFNQPGLHAVAQALSDLQLVEATPDLTHYVAEAYLPQ